MSSTNAEKKLIIPDLINECVSTVAADGVVVVGVRVDEGRISGSGYGGGYGVAVVGAVTKP